MYRYQELYSNYVLNSISFMFYRLYLDEETIESEENDENEKQRQVPFHGHPTAILK